MNYPSKYSAPPRETLLSPEEWAQARAEDASFRRKIRVWLMWGLLLVGFILVYKAGALGISAVATPNQYGSGSSWSPDQAREAAMNLRFLGAMIFMAGLVERVLLSIHPTNDQTKP